MTSKICKYDAPVLGVGAEYHSRVWRYLKNKEGSLLSGFMSAAWRDTLTVSDARRLKQHDLHLSLRVQSLSDITKTRLEDKFPN